MNNKYDIKPLPRDSKGKIRLNEYRELMWFSQQQQERDIKKLNGRISSNEDDIDSLKKDALYIKVVGTVAFSTIAFIGKIRAFLGF